MIDLAIIVEGQSEEAFVKRLLQPHLFSHGVNPWPVLPGRGENRRGGRWPWESVRGDAARLLKGRAGRRCAVMFDYYGLPPDWPGRSDSAVGPMEDRGSRVEAALGQDLAGVLGDSFSADLFIPHVQLHEFEARLFSDCGALGHAIGVEAGRLSSIVDECGGPERIDDGQVTAPSKRILALAPSYRKVGTGVVVSEAIGLATMRQKCPHFDRWLTRLEGLSSNG